MKYEDYPINYKVEGHIDNTILYEIINKCEADKVVLTSKSYVIHGSLLYTYEKLKLLDVEFDETLKKQPMVFTKKQYSNR